MSNMSYCRFENTLADLRDCEQALDEGAATDPDLSRSEKRALKELIELCADIARRYGDSE